VTTSATATAGAPDIGDRVDVVLPCLDEVAALPWVLSLVFAGEPGPWMPAGLAAVRQVG
jgi:hypothetical protein